MQIEPGCRCLRCWWAASATGRVSDMKPEADFAPVRCGVRVWCSLTTEETRLITRERLRLTSEEGERMRIEILYSK